jgi:hypothetical protein
MLRGLTMGVVMSAVEYPGAELTPAERWDLRRLAGGMARANAGYGASAAAIFADVVGSLGRDCAAVRQALVCDFAGLDEAQAAAMTLLGRESPVMTALGRAVLQFYYRDDRVIRALGLEARPPYPKGRVVEEGDRSRLDAVRGRPRMGRDVDGTER